MLEGPPRVACLSRGSASAFAGIALSVTLATFASPARAEPPAEPADKPTDIRERDSGSAPLRIGALAGIGLPRPLAIEALVKLDDVVAVGIEYSLMPKVTVSGVDATFNAITGDLRFFPLRNGFFIGIAGGRQHVGATTVVTLPGSLAALGSFPEQVTADTWFINPRIGFLSTWSWGLTLGCDVGVQIPLSATFTNTIPSQLSASQDATNVAHFFGKSVLPTVDLLRIGLLF